MIDATHASVKNIPTTAPKVGGYMTGTVDILWTPDDWKRFPDSGHVRIEQGFGTFQPLDCDVYDVENRGVTAAQAAQGVKTRIEHGAPVVTIYGSDGALAAVRAALDAIAFGKPDWWHGHADAWLADWNLNAKEASAKLGTTLHGFVCRAVQWASPTSNPATKVPGSALTLKQANVDLSVTQDGWHPHSKAQSELHGIVVRADIGALHVAKVVSKDNGQTWNVVTLATAAKLADPAVANLGAVSPGTVPDTEHDAGSSGGQSS